jgi:predicted lipase
MYDNAHIVNSVVAKATTMYPSYKIVTAGHSLGGAIAALVGTQLRNKGHIVDIVSYTFNTTLTCRSEMHIIDNKIRF